MPLRQADIDFLQNKWYREKGCLKARLTILSLTAACIYGNDFIIQDAVVMLRLCALTGHEWQTSFPWKMTYTVACFLYTETSIGHL